MFNILSKYDNHQVILNKFLESNIGQKVIFESKSKFPSYHLGTNDTARATGEMFSAFENWVFDLVDDNINDLECFAFLDSYGSRIQGMMRDYLINSEEFVSQEA